VVTYETAGARAGARTARQTVERRRAELGGFLKAHRAKLSPEEFGMPPGSRRRTPGLRREEVALLAGVGVTWYTWLEQGREINASQQVLDAVAQTLQLSQAEREHMYRLAEAVPVRPNDTCGAVPDAIREIVMALEPLPASLINARFDTLLRNGAADDLFEEWHSLPCIHKNSLWCCVTEPTARAKFPEYDEHVRYLVGRLRAAYGAHVGDPEWEEDIRRLSSLSSEFAELWARHEVASPQPRSLTYLHPRAGKLRLSLSELDLPQLPETRIVVYTPADTETRDWLALTRRPKGLERQVDIPLAVDLDARDQRDVAGFELLGEKCGEGLLVAGEDGCRIAVGAAAGVLADAALTGEAN
jgi:transcriptional regulator with XRE-family HTH domain